MKTKAVFTSLLVGAGALSAFAQKTQQPNIVLIMCDDMGFSDLGCYGSEIQTPNIDRLAQEGLRFSQFKNTGRSCPSRASLLTGRYQHDVDLGWMTAVDEHRPGYRGQISFSAPTIAELLKGNGYSTYMTGKWHVTVDGAFGHPNGSYPTQRGFDRYYGCLSGGGSYYKPKPVYNDLTPVNDFPDDYYYTTAISDSASAFVERHDANKPLFLYVAYYAPHLPLQAPEDRIQKCLPRYKAGFDILRRQRFAKQKSLGIVPKDLELPPVHNKEFGGKHPAWEDLTDEQRTKWTRDMATYAAMIEIVDDGIGQLVETFRQKGILDNTVFILLSDNGSTSEGGYLNQLRADLSNTPYRNYKQWVFQGGTSSPLILTFGNPAKNVRRGEITNELGHITDIVPTCLDLSQTNCPKQVTGISLLPTLKGKKLANRDLFFEHQSSCAIISNGWKLVREDKNTPWELIHLADDPYEMKNVANEYPDMVKKLEKKWNRWAEKYHVMPLENRSWSNRINYYKQLFPDQSGTK